MPSDWGGRAEPGLTVGVTLWITGACMGMVIGAVLAVWAFRFHNGQAGMILLAGSMLAGLAMTAGLDYAAIRDEQEGRE